MRRGLSLVGLAIAASMPTAGRATASTDWVLTSMHVTPLAQPQSSPGGSETISIGPGPGRGANLEISGAGHSTGNGSLLLGSGISDGGFALIDIFDAGNGGIRLRTTKDTGSLDVQVTPGTSGTFRFTVGFGSLGSRPREIALIVFFPNAVIDSFTSNGSGGIAAPTTQSGSGSRAIAVAGPDAGGVAVDAAAVAAGASTYDASLDRGIVGGVLFGCTHCTVDWKAPDGVSGSATQTATPFVPLPVPVPIPLGGGSGSGDFTFAGPSGAWSWAWTGINIRTDFAPTYFAAYAPIGDAWRLFRPGAPSLPPPPSPQKPAERSPSHHKTAVLAEKRTRALAATGVGSFWEGWLLLGLAAVCGRRLLRSAR